jgi:hypothetical protein
MVSEVSRYRASTDVERRYAGELDAVYHRAETGEALAAGIAQVTKRSLVEAMGMNILRRAAEQLTPDGAAHYEMIISAGVCGLTNNISEMGRPR